MAFGTRHRHTTTTAPSTRSSFFSRRRHNRTTRREPIVVREPVHHHKRHASLGDKISGAMLKLKGTITRRPGEKAAGTRRMRGTDGRGSHRTRRAIF